MASDGKIDLPGLEALLQKSLDSERLRVIDYTATNLVPLGENYGSLMIKLDVTIRRNEAAGDERLNLVAKASTKIDDPILEWAPVIKKEIFVYADLLPIYRSLEREMGIDEVIDPLPKYIGHRYTLDPYESEKIDDDALLLMENLKSRGFYTCDRREGLDFHHAEKAVTLLAKYHALGIVLKQKRTDDFAAAIDGSRLTGLFLLKMKQLIDSALKIFQEEACFRKYLPAIEASFAIYKKRRSDPSDNSRNQPDESVWSTIIHGDIWVNNMMFHKDDSGNVDEVKLIDFQLYHRASALKDLAHLLYGSLDEATMANRVDELMHSYYRTFTRTIDRMGCDAGPFTKNGFEEGLREEAIAEFPLAALRIKFFTYEIRDEQKDSAEVMSNIVGSDCNDACRDKLLKLIGVYERKGWF